jgi:hypothetical protein
MDATAPITDPIPEQFKLHFTVPPSHLEACKTAIFATNAGTYNATPSHASPVPLYERVSCEYPITARFTPAAGSKPFLGTPGVEEVVQEIKVEVFVEGRDGVKRAVTALKMAHPYEVVAYEVYKMEPGF